MTLVQKGHEQSEEEIHASRRVLGRIALKLHSNMTRDFTGDDALQCLEGDEAMHKTWRMIEEATLLCHISLLAFFLDSSTGKTIFRFSHLSFQEFLAADHAAGCFEAGITQGLPILEEIA